MTKNKTYTMFWSVLVTLFLSSLVYAQSNLERARQREREANQKAERVNPDSPQADRVYQDAVKATEARERIERQERNRPEMTAPRENDRMFDKTPAREWKDTMTAPRESRDTFDRRPTAGREPQPFQRSLPPERRTFEPNRPDTNRNSDDYLSVQKNPPAGTLNNPVREKMYYQNGVPVLENTWNYSYQTAKNLRTSVLTLPNRDQILLPHRSLWKGESSVTVTSRQMGGQMQYLVSISSSDSRPFRQRVLEFIRDEGIAEAVGYGLARVIRDPYAGAIVQTLQPDPVGNDVVFRTVSARNGYIEVHILNVSK